MKHEHERVGVDFGWMDFEYPHKRETEMKELRDRERKKEMMQAYILPST